MNAGEIISLRLLASYVPQPLADITTWVACVSVWKVCSQQWRLEAHFGEWGRCAFFAQIAAHLVILTSVDVLLFFCWYLAAIFLLMPALCLLLSLLWRLWGRCVARRCLNTSILLSLSLNIAMVRNCWCQGSLSGTSRLLGFLGKTQGKFKGRLVRKGNRTNTSADLCGIRHRDDQKEECVERNTLPFFAMFSPSLALLLPPITTCPFSALSGPFHPEGTCVL